MSDSITCPQCGRTSHNPNDVREKYCGACHQYHDTMPVAKLRAAQKAFALAADNAVEAMNKSRLLSNKSIIALTDFVKAAADLDEQVDVYVGHVQQLNTQKETPQREGE